MRRRSLRGDRLEAELDDELRFHLESRIEQLREEGATGEEARRRAIEEFGDLDAVRAELLAIDRRTAAKRRRTDRADALRRDLRLAARRLLRRPGFSIPAIVTLGIGLGVATAVFALADAVLLSPLPYPDSERLVVVRNVAPGLGLDPGGLSDGVYLHYRQNNRVFEDVAAYFDRTLSVTDGETPERIRTALVAPNLFAVLRSAAAVGRTCRDGDEAADPLRVVLSHGLWVRRYGADPRVVGRTIELNRRPREIVGVMPPDFAFPAPDTELWFCWTYDDSRAGITDLHQTGVGRLREGIGPVRAREDLQRLIPLLAETYPDATPARIAEAALAAEVVPLRDEVVRDVRPALGLLACAGALMLLMALANVANLFLLRADRRRHETAVARALGAGSWALSRQALVEGALLAGLAAAVAVALAWLTVQARFGLAGADIPRLHEVRMDGTVVAVAAALSLATAVVLGLVATFSTAFRGPGSGLRGSGGFGGGSSGQNARRTLVAVQAALAFTLAVAALSMVESARRMHAFRPGFDTEDVVTFEVALPASPYPGYDPDAAFFFSLLDGLEKIPGVEAAAMAGNLPLTAAPFLDQPVVPEGGDEDAALPATGNPVSPGYFRAMGIRLAAGRGFAPDEPLGERRPVVVSAGLARALFGGEHEAVGRRLRRVRGGADALHTVVGVVEDVPGATLAGAGAPVLYLPLPEELPDAPWAEAAVPFHPNEMAVLVRSGLLPSEVVAAARSIVSELDPKVPVASVRTLEQMVAAASARTRFTALLLTFAAVVALLLAGVGIYGVVSFAVSRRTPELAVRLALGARPEDVRRLVAGQAGGLALAGIAAGALAGVALLRVLRAILFQVGPADPLLLAATAVIVLAVAMAASWVPARRAAAVQPGRALAAD